MLLAKNLIQMKTIFSKTYTMKDRIYNKINALKQQPNSKTIIVSDKNHGTTVLTFKYFRIANVYLNKNFFTSNM